jgi:hypothetical protein
MSQCDFPAPDTGKKKFSASSRPDLSNRGLVAIGEVKKLMEMRKKAQSV